MGRSTESTSGREVVYGHKMLAEARFFHIGSGSERRARNFTGRSPRWRAYVDEHGDLSQVEVKILERHGCPARARLREMELVNIHKPSTNSFGRPPFPAAIRDGRPKGSKQRCTCGAPDCYGAEVAAPVGSYRVRRNGAECPSMNAE
jgi:hypothetical protein